MRWLLFLCSLVVVLFVIVERQDDKKPAAVLQVASEPTDKADSVRVLKTNPDVVSKDEVWSEPSADAVLTKLKEWDDDDDPALRAERLSELEALLSGTNALEIVETLPADFIGYVFALPSFREQLLVNPQASLGWMEEHTNVQSQLLTFLHDWSEQDSREMQQYLDGMPDGEWREKVLSAAANEALSRDPAGAIAMAVQMESSPERMQWLSTATSEWAKQNPDAAAQWTAQITDSDLRDHLLASVVAGAAENNPDQALDFLERFQLSDAAFNQSIADIVWTCALRDSGATAAWVEHFPEGPARQVALKNLIAVWGNHQADAAGAWVEKLPPGNFQFQAIQDLYSVFLDGASDCAQ
jgi:hypothetical protein